MKIFSFALPLAVGGLAAWLTMGSMSQYAALVQPPRPSVDGMRRVGVRQAMDGGPAVGSAAPASGGYAVGERVEHPKFGVGIVRRIETLATDHKLVVAFDNAGEKTLLAKFAKLTKLG